MIKNFLLSDLGWQEEEVEVALNELEDYSSIYYQQALDRALQLDKENETRMNVFLDDMFTHGITQIQNEPANYFVRLLNIEPMFRALALINTHYYFKDNSNPSADILYPNSKKSLIYWKSRLSTEMSQIQKTNKDIFASSDNYSSPIMLSYYIANKMFMQIYGESSQLEKEYLITILLEQVGFVALNLSDVKNHFNKLTYNVCSNREPLISYLSSMNNKHLARNTINVKRYWLIYALVEELVSRGYGIRESFRECERLLGEKKHTIQRRYYDMKKQSEKENLSAPKIVNRYGLGQALYDLVLKLP